MCAYDSYTGETYDTRYKATNKWQMSNYDIMKENGVFKAVYRPEPEVATGILGDYDYYAGLSTPPLIWEWAFTQ